MKFVHTADWQIGMKAVHVAAAGEQVRQARLESARTLVEQANGHGAEFLLLAGDTFEHLEVDLKTVREVVRILAGFRGEVFVLPGNHDPWTAGSFWEDKLWRDVPNLRVPHGPEPLALPGGTLFPCPLRSKTGTQDPTEVIPDDCGAGGIRIGMAHGELKINDKSKYFPIAFDAASRKGLDYLALGHWHSYLPYKDSSDAIRTAYSGTHEPTSFGERDSGNALLVEIEAPRAAPKITLLHTGQLAWKSEPVDVRSAADVDAARDQLRKTENPRQTLVKLTWSGSLSRLELPLIEDAREELEGLFLYFSQVSSVVPEADDDGWIDEIPDGPVRQAARKLLGWSRGDVAPPDVTRAQAADALGELFTFSRRGSA